MEDQKIDLTYENEGVYLANKGATILETSLKNEIPHIHECGGHAQCSTCRVIVLEGGQNLGPRTDAEKILAQKKNFEENIRLACQTRVLGPARIRRLVLDDTDADIAQTTSGPGGHEERLAIMFSDIRDFTPLSERQLPYDIVHILNRYFTQMGTIILNHQGYIDKYMGDGIMALFGLNSSNDDEKCTSAANAALEMMKSLDDVNKYLEKQFGEKLRMGIGLHFDKVIVGEVGHPKHRQFTALGDGVNVASRIQGATKKAHSSVLVSQSFAEQAGQTIRLGRSFKAQLKGKSHTLKLYELLQLSTL